MYYENDLGVFLKIADDDTVLVVKQTGLSIIRSTKEDIEKATGSMNPVSKTKFINATKASLKTIKSYIK